MTQLQVCQARVTSNTTLTREEDDIARSVSSYLPLDETNKFMKLAKDLQCLHYHSVGKHYHRVIESSYEQKLILQKCIGMALYNLPEEEEVKSNEFTGYPPNKLAEINVLCAHIMDTNARYDSRRKNKDEIHYTIIYIIVLTCKNSQVFQVPVFKVFPNENNEDNPKFIDNKGKVYENFDHFLQKNDLPDCLICTPRDGRYTWDAVQQLPDVSFVSCRKSFFEKSLVVAQNTLVFFEKLFMNIIFIAPKSWLKFNGVAILSIFVFNLFQIGVRAWHGEEIDYFKEVGSLLLNLTPPLLYLAGVLFQKGKLSTSVLTNSSIFQSFIDICNKQKNNLLVQLDKVQFKSLVNFFSNRYISDISLNQIINADFWKSLTRFKYIPIKDRGAGASGGEIVKTNDFIQYFTASPLSLASNLFDAIDQAFRSSVIRLSRRDISWNNLKHILRQSLQFILENIFKVIAEQNNIKNWDAVPFGQKQLNLNSTDRRLKYCMSAQEARNVVQDKNFLKNLAMGPSPDQENAESHDFIGTHAAVQNMVNNFLVIVDPHGSMDNYVLVSKFIKDYIFRKVSEQLSSLTVQLDDKIFNDLYRSALDVVDSEIGALQTGNHQQHQIYIQYLKFMDEKSEYSSNLILLRTGDEYDLYTFRCPDNFDIHEIAFDITGSREAKVMKLGGESYGISYDQIHALAVIFEVDDNDKVGFVYVYLSHE